MVIIREVNKKKLFQFDWKRTWSKNESPGRRLGGCGGLNKTKNESGTEKNREEKKKRKKKKNVHPRTGGRRIKESVTMKKEAGG